MVEDEAFVSPPLPSPSKFITVDNGELPGNRTLSSESLLTFWKGGGMYGLYEWYAIVGSFSVASR